MLTPTVVRHADKAGLWAELQEASASEVPQMLAAAVRWVG